MPLGTFGDYQRFIAHGMPLAVAIADLEDSGLSMDSSTKKPRILGVETVAHSRLFNVESVDLEFSNGERRVYERMRPSGREAVMILPILGEDLLLIREYAVGIEEIGRAHV